jgi:prepilin-type N-terminal cleavage/methylation domain-containing protein
VIKEIGLVYMYNEKQKAFTLIELLVVISVITMLTAILMPTLSVARFELRHGKRRLFRTGCQ